MELGLEKMPEDWERLLAIVAHPDDLEYGAASAVARWTRSGKWVGYVVVTNGEAGIDAVPPDQAGAVRVAEQETSAKIVGVEDVAFLGYRDGVVEYSTALRRDLAREIRRYRPDVLLIATFDLTYGLSPQQRIVNQADHRAVGFSTPRRRPRPRKPVDLPRTGRQLSKPRPRPRRSSAADSSRRPPVPPARRVLQESGSAAPRT
jgi:LmbE family N-acetylglucosaminyl deacetylase